MNGLGLFRKEPCSLHFSGLNKKERKTVYWNLHKHMTLCDQLERIERRLDKCWNRGNPCPGRTKHLLIQEERVRRLVVKEENQT